MFGNEGQQTGSEGGSGGEDIFDMIGNAEVNEGGVYFLPGQYVAAINLMKIVRSQKDNHRKFICEFAILKSDNENRAAGMQVGWVRDLDGRYPKANAGEIRALLAASMNVPVEQVDSEGAKFAVSPKNPTHGRLVRVEAFQKEGKDFTNCRFFGLDDETQKKGADAAKKALGGGGGGGGGGNQDFGPPPMTDDDVPF